jgi:LAS superfamily LD-carboxypeptidase LdcB
MDKQETKEEETPHSTVHISKVMGHFNPANDDDFTLVEKKFADREGMYIHRDTYNAFQEMWAHAQKDGVQLVIRSATRNFDYQKGIWERKWTGATKVKGNDLSETIENPKERALEILHYSSMPGTSRHHWGTDLDFNSFDNSYFESGKGLQVYNWLVKNAPSYGFFRPYTEKGEARPHGYEEEKWHWSYQPLASQYMTTAHTELKNEIIQGFQGSETASEIDVVSKYVKGVATFEGQKK